jgi:hypothetical protein
LSQTSASGGQLGGCSEVDRWGAVEVSLEEAQNYPCLTQCSRLVSVQGVQSAMFLSSLIIKGPPCPREKKIKKNKETWILFSTSSTMIKLHFEFGKTAKNKQKDLNTNKI